MNAPHGPLSIERESRFSKKRKKIRERGKRNCGRRGEPPAAPTTGEDAGAATSHRIVFSRLPSAGRHALPSLTPSLSPPERLFLFQSVVQPSLFEYRVACFARARFASTLFLSVVDFHTLPSRRTDPRLDGNRHGSWSIVCATRP
jgi:hypothetical protein